jgi:hypothetical protein
VSVLTLTTLASLVASRREQRADSA